MIHSHALSNNITVTAAVPDLCLGSVFHPKLTSTIIGKLEADIMEDITIELNARALTRPRLPGSSLECINGASHHGWSQLSVLLEVKTQPYSTATDDVSVPTPYSVYPRPQIPDSLLCTVCSQGTNSALDLMRTSSSEDAPVTHSRGSVGRLTTVFSLCKPDEHVGDLGSVLTLRA